METVRKSFVAGQFYPGSERACIEDIRKYAKAPESIKGRGSIRAGIVPHAGWMFSGPTAGKVFAAIADDNTPSTFIVFGAVHRYMGGTPVMMAEGEWETPLGGIEIDTDVAGKILDNIDTGIVAGMDAHEGEHSIEVQAPFIRRLFPEAKIVPVLVPPAGEAAALGDSIGGLFADRDEIVAIGSTDLTHYGPEYGFAPKGTGEDALAWVKEVNDRRIIDLMTAMKAEDIVPEAARHHNSCGAGAIAAAVSFARACGKDSGMLVEYTTSHDVLPRGKPTMFVGYAGVVF